ncbi:GPI transamidase component PIG-T [Lipomyces arxii]|uniref:GPI transamidase component PIG-T n=1 Tax=Lipomyces arxii TaxID=56418 RepID=UPI0034CF5094
MLYKELLLNVLALCLLFSHSQATESSYKERLDLTPLPRNTLLASFNFELYSDPNIVGQNETIWAETHYALFPRSVGQIVRSTSTHDLHLRFSQGWWESEDWGSLPHNGRHSGGTGVELWANVAGKTREEAENRWYELASALSGLFCASLNFIDSTKTTSGPTAFLQNNQTSGLYYFHGSLPQETICTENLTPFLKLLPCKGFAGVSSLLDGHQIFDSKWQSMALDFVPVCDGESCKLHMTEKIDVVLDVQRLMGRKANPIPEPPPVSQLNCNTSKTYHSDSICFPLASPEEINWKLSDIFGTTVRSRCIPDHTSILTDAELNHSICTHVTPEWDVVREGGSLSYSGGNVACYSLTQNEIFDLAFSTTRSSSVSVPDRPPVYVQRSMTGRGQQNGGIQIIITNPSPTESVSLIYFESLPWFMKTYMHTMTEVLSLPNPDSVAITDVIKKANYKPSLERVRDSSLELYIELPASARLTLSYDFDNVLLYLIEYPPDANRGFDVSPAIVTVLTELDGIMTPSYALRTSSLLLSLPTPDFSMPYNVIILTSTVMALAFGTIFNILVRRFVYEEDIQRDSVSVLARLKQHLTSRFKTKETAASERPKSAE